MKRLYVAAVLCIGAPAFAPAAESDGEALAAAMRCGGCHETDRALIGPPYRAIAARHAAADREHIVEVLAQKIIAGGAGNWGVVPMVPNEHVSEDDARAIARWILGLQ